MRRKKRKKRFYVILIVLLLTTLAIVVNANTTSLTSDRTWVLSGDTFEYKVANGANDTGAHVIINRVYALNDYEVESGKIYVNTGHWHKRN